MCFLLRSWLGPGPGLGFSSNDKIPFFRFTQKIKKKGQNTLFFLSQTGTGASARSTSPLSHYLIVSLLPLVRSYPPSSEEEISYGQDNYYYWEHPELRGGCSTTVQPNRNFISSINGKKDAHEHLMVERKDHTLIQPLMKLKKNKIISLLKDGN